MTVAKCLGPMPLRFNNFCGVFSIMSKIVWPNPSIKTLAETGPVPLVNSESKYLVIPSNLLGVVYGRYLL